MDTILDRGEATARDFADQLGHAKDSMTQDHYLEGGTVNERNAEILESAVAL